MKQPYWLLWAAWFMLSLPCLAQTHHSSKDGDKVQLKYKITSNAPDSANNLSLFLALGGIYSTYNQAVGPSATFNYCFRNRIAVFANATYSISENHGMDLQQGTPAVSLTHWYNYEAGAALTFMKEMHQETENVQVDYKDGVHYEATIPAEKLRMNALRGGYGFYNSFFNASSVNFSGYNVADPKHNVINMEQYTSGNPEFNRYGAMMQVPYLFVGVNTAQISDISAIFTGYKGVKSFSRKIQFGVDFLYAQTITYSDVTITDGTTANNLPAGTYHINDNTPKSRIGGRAFVAFYPVHSIGFAYYAEGGVMPGIPNGWYLTIRAGIPLNAKVLE